MDTAVNIPDTTGLRDLDGRTRRAKDIKSFVGNITAALGGDVSPQRACIIWHAAHTNDRLLELAQANDLRPEDFDAYLRGANTLLRYLTALGLDRAARDVGSTLDAYLEQQTPPAPIEDPHVPDFEAEDDTCET